MLRELSVLNVKQVKSVKVSTVVQIVYLDNIKATVVQNAGPVTLDNIKTSMVKVSVLNVRLVKLLK